MIRPNKQKTHLNTAHKTLIILILWIIIIWYMSLVSGENSAKQSNALLGCLDIFFKQLSITVSPAIIIRKTAHFSEYFILALLSFRYRRLKKEYFVEQTPSDLSAINALLKSNHSLFALNLFCGLTGPVVAIIDEQLIQRFLAKNRGPSWTDVLIDCGGFIIGILVSLIWWKISHKKNKQC